MPTIVEFGGGSKGKSAFIWRRNYSLFVINGDVKNGDTYSSDMTHISWSIYNAGNIKSITVSRGIGLNMVLKDGTTTTRSGTTIDMSDVVLAGVNTNAGYAISITFNCE